MANDTDAGVEVTINILFEKMKKAEGKDYTFLGGNS